MDDWDEYLENEEIESKINNYLNNNGYVMFFKKDDDIFGAPEEGRITFAKMKNPDGDLPDSWSKDASFSADNISKALEGINNQAFVGKDTVGKIKVIDQDNAKGLLINKAKKLGNGLKLQSKRIFIMPGGDDG